MKKIYLITILALMSVGGYCQQGQWTWMNGSNTNQVPVWGTQGTFAAANTPPGMYEACQWTDLNGKFWMYGGLDSTDLNQYADLWEFDPATNQWAWIKGPGIPQSQPVYGTIGVPASANSPGGRGYGIATWVDNNNNLWLFGGWNNGWGGIFSDLWMYSIASNEWTWMSGASGPNSSPGTYGTLGIPNSANHPPARCETNATWTDAANNLWIFGGETFGSNYNDLWRYSVDSNHWTWVNGPNVPGGAGVWGIKGVPAASNVPSSRMVYAKWKDHLGNFWLFGGMNGDSTSPGLYNDLWRYTPSSNLWTWMSGTDNLNDPGFCFGSCISSINNIPSARFENRACFQTGCDEEHFQFFGGGGDLDANSNLNDLWDYCVATNTWTLVSGSPYPTLNQPSVYGTKLVSSSNNIPGGRMGSIGWTDPVTQAFWLFSGVAVWSGPFANHPNDMWRFVPDTTCPYSPHITTSAFTVDTLSGCAPLAVQFTNNSIGAISFLWNFGDSTISNTANPSHVFDTSGNYMVTLIAYDSTACGIFVDTTFQTLSITVFNPPIPPIISQIGDTLISSFATGNQWFKDSISISGATNEIYIGPSTGCYYVTETDSQGCTSISDTVCFTFTGIPAIPNNHGISIYPNPNDGSFTIYGLGIGTYDLKIEDVLGRIVYSCNISKLSPLNSQVSIPLSNGLYFYELISNSAQAGEVSRGKIMVQK